MMYGGDVGADRWGNVITDVSGLQGGTGMLLEKWGLEEGCHKGESKKPRQCHLSCETIAGKKLNQGFYLFIYFT